MSDPDALRAAAGTGMLSPERAHRELLESIVQVARAIFAARASSIMLFDEPAGELVFEAVAGEGSERLVGTRFPATQGIAGWVLASGEPMVLEDVSADPRFARDVAERSGYVPKGLMAVPLHTDSGPLGVLQVLDRPKRAQFSLRESELLALFGEQAAIALALVQRARRAQAALGAQGGEAAVVARLAAALDGLEGERRQEVLALLEALAGVLGRR